MVNGNGWLGGAGLRRIQMMVMVLYFQVRILDNETDY